MIERLKELNPEIAFYDIHSLEFKEYGRVITDFDARALITAAEKIKLPENQSTYIPSCREFEELPEAKLIEEQFFGTLPAQVGYCYGHSNYLNATEWHFSSEINVAVTPLVIIVAKRQQMIDNRLNSSGMKAFYVPAGTVIETYATTLHFCPCEVQKSGFGWIVALPAGTNTPLEQPPINKLLTKKNKWQIAHEDNVKLIENGVVPGIFGENFRIKY